MIKLTLFIIIGKNCCEKFKCFRNPGPDGLSVNKIEKARMLWSESARIIPENTLLLNTLHGFMEDTDQKADIRLRVMGVECCRRAFGMVYNIRRTRLFD